MKTRNPCAPLDNIGIFDCDCGKTTEMNILTPTTSSLSTLTLYLLPHYYRLTVLLLDIILRGCCCFSNSGESKFH